MSPDEPELPLDAVKGKLDEIQRRRRSKVRWKIGKHTAELAIAALATAAPKRGRGGKPKRRSRHKRLL